MSVRLSADEAWNVVGASHTGIFTTLRADGSPISLPVWFVVHERTVCLAAPNGTKKLARIRRDPRAAFLVESGARWAELVAVHLSGTVDIIEEEPLLGTLAAELDEKYAAFRTDRDAMAPSTQTHYGNRTFLQLHPEGRILSWDNARLSLKDR